MLELERQTQEQQRLERLNKEHVEKDKEQEKRITELQRQLEESIAENKELNDTLSQATNQLSGECVNAERINKILQTKEDLHFSGTAIQHEQ